MTTGIRAKVAALLLSAAMMNVAYTVLIPLVPTLSERFHLSPFEIAAAFGGFALAKALAQPLGGILVDRVANPALLGFLGLGITAGSIAGLAFAGAGWQILAWRLAWGVAEGLTMPALYRLASALGSESEYGTSKVMGWFGAACAGGMVVGPLLVGALYPFLGFTGVFLTGAAVTAGGGVLLLSMRHSLNTLQESESDTGHDKAATGATMRLVAVLVGLFAVVDLVNNAVFAAMEPVLPLHLDQVTGDGVAFTSVIFSIGLAVFMVGTMASSRIVERKPLLVVAGLSFGVETVGLAVLGLTDGIVALCAGFLLFMAAQPVLYMVARQGVNLVPRHQLGRAFGAFGLVSDIGFIVGPLIGALVYGWTGSGVFLALAAVTAVTGVALFAARAMPDRLVAGIYQPAPVEPRDATPAP
ncbi:Sugar phosphate permease [Actinokineospora alba]|uniref:Sugar phosphate permease n=1 Tax=Actinokineospora alba TaxID=504798 RepID=A0A1H0HAW1_9PSEU|nr:MFS transporter [Actinokineospora alba]TDP64959.1 sugar phosphate permease [Actinokineospora alba]SDH50319.1 Sugar phosphate permease [Actinokineospora alba]SDO16292.1 Sugar phosphate permease [Actinokineospora alba]